MTDYQLNSIYHIRPFSTLPPYEALFIGYIIERPNSYDSNWKPNCSRFNWAVFKTNEDMPRLMALDDKGEYVSQGKTPADLVEHFKSQWVYMGCEWQTIKVAGQEVLRETFVEQARAAGIPEPQLDTALSNGSFGSAQGPRGEIKHCSTCKVIRQTSCCACGCGSCETCGYRWCCMPYIPSPEPSGLARGLFSFRIYDTGNLGDMYVINTTGHPPI